MLWLLIGSLSMGAGTMVLAYAGEEYYFLGLAALEKDFRDKLRRLRISSRRLRAWLVTWSFFVLANFLMWVLLLDSPVFAVLTSLFWIAGPWYLLYRWAEQRRQKIEDQLADSMVALSSAIRAGLSLGQALQILAEQCPKPICQEFRQICGEFQMGKPLEQCLVETRDRLQSENFALFSAAMLASRESGGKLNETVERIAHSVLEMQRLERKIKSETAQARTSATYMALAPFFILALYYLVVDPVNTEKLFTTFPGQLLLSMSIIMVVVAYLWARQILNPDI